MDEENAQAIDEYIARQVAIKDLQALMALYGTFAIMLPLLVSVFGTKLQLSTWAISASVLMSSPLSLLAARAWRSARRRLNDLYEEDHAAAEARQRTRQRRQVDAG
jgi:membrane protein implicated in regulation of membrane protease activity